MRLKNIMNNNKIQRKIFKRLTKPAIQKVSRALTPHAHFNWKHSVAAFSNEQINAYCCVNTKMTWRDVYSFYHIYKPTRDISVISSKPCLQVLKKQLEMEM